MIPSSESPIKSASQGSATQCQHRAARVTCTTEPVVYEHRSTAEYFDPLSIHLLSFSHQVITHRCMAAGVLAFPHDNALQCSITNSQPPPLRHPGIGISSHPVNREPLRCWATESHGPTPQPHPRGQAAEKHTRRQGPQQAAVSWGEQCSLINPLSV